MHPPSASCKVLHRYHPQLRLAWQGRSRRFAGELNPGSFALVQLYHIDDVGSLENPHTFREFWNITSELDVMGELQNVRAYRGPIFNRYGGTSLDYDPLTRVPIFVSTLDGGYSYPNGDPLCLEDIYTGEFMFAIEAWGTSIKKRVQNSKRQRALAMKTATTEMSDQFMEDLKVMDKSDPSHSGPIIARKHAREDHIRQENRAARISSDLNESFGVDDVF